MLMLPLYQNYLLGKQLVLELDLQYYCCNVVSPRGESWSSGRRGLRAPELWAASPGSVCEDVTLEQRWQHVPESWAASPRAVQAACSRVVGCEPQSSTSSMFQSCGLRAPEQRGQQVQEQPYKQKLKQEDPSQKEVQCWSEAVEDHLWVCLESINWIVFKSSVENLDENATTVADSISKCMETTISEDRHLRKFGISTGTLTNFYRCTIASILSGCITNWYGNFSAQDLNKLKNI
eukprot:g45646.t1